MSRVTIDDITGDYYNDHTDKSIAISDVEVVPRKIVEMIIDKCNDEMDCCDKFEGNEYYDGKFDGVGFIKNIAKMLLKEFEEDT